MTVTRREAVKALGAAAVWPYISDASAETFARIQAGKAPPSPKFLDAAQFTTLDALVEAIIPEDAHSPGARAARVADYIDLLLAESDGATQKAWTSGLSLLDAESRMSFGVPFARLTSAQASTLLAAISKNEAAPRSPLEQFFTATKHATIRGYYTSEIGIQRELEYKGNRVLAGFVGCTHPEHGYEPGR